jgi:hypothetical protein
MIRIIIVVLAFSNAVLEERRSSVLKIQKIAHGKSADPVIRVNAAQKKSRNGAGGHDDIVARK